MNKTTQHDLYHTWMNLRARCGNPNNPKYIHYGGRGIVVCDEWEESFHQFIEDMGERPEGLTIDRIDNDGNYEPSNCRWATYKEQNNNQRVRGDLKSARLIDPNGVRYVVKAGFTHKFCKIMDLNIGHISETLRSKRPHHKGWTGKYLE